MSKADTAQRWANASYAIANMTQSIASLKGKMDSVYDTKMGNAANITMQNGLTDIFNDVDDTKWEERINKYRDEQWIQDVVALTGLDEERVQRYFDKNHDSLYGAFNYSAERAAKAGYQALADTQYDADMNLQASKTNVNFRGLIGSARALDVQNEGLYDEDHRENWTDVGKMSGLLQTNGAMRLRALADNAVASASGFMSREEFVKKYGSEGELGAEYEDAMNVIFKSAEYQTRSNAYDEEGQKEYLGVFKDSKLWDELAGEAYDVALKEYQSGVNSALDSYSVNKVNAAYTGETFSGITVQEVYEFLEAQDIDYTSPAAMACIVQKFPSTREVLENEDARWAEAEQVAVDSYWSANSANFLSRVEKDRQAVEDAKDSDGSEVERAAFTDANGKKWAYDCEGTGQVAVYSATGTEMKVIENDAGVLSSSCQSYISTTAASLSGEKGDSVYSYVPGLVEEYCQERGITDPKQKMYIASLFNLKLASSGSTSKAAEATNPISDFTSNQYYNEICNLISSGASEDAVTEMIALFQANGLITPAMGNDLAKQKGAYFSISDAYKERAEAHIDQVGKELYPSGTGNKSWATSSPYFSANTTLRTQVAQWLERNPDASDEDLDNIIRQNMYNGDAKAYTDNLDKQWKIITGAVEAGEMRAVDTLNESASTVIALAFNGDNFFYNEHIDTFEEARRLIQEGAKGYTTTSEQRDSLAAKIYGGKKYKDLTDIQKANINSGLMPTLYRAAASKDAKPLAEAFSEKLGQEMKEISLEDGRIGFASSSGFVIIPTPDEHSWYVSKITPYGNSTYEDALRGDATLPLAMVYENYSTYTPVIGAYSSHVTKNAETEKFMKTKEYEELVQRGRIRPTEDGYDIYNVKKFSDITTGDIANDSALQQIIFNLNSSAHKIYQGTINA